MRDLLLIVRKKWLGYSLLGVACLAVGGVFLMPEVVSAAWHLLHGRSARFREWEVPVPTGWWAFTSKDKGALIVQRMKRSAEDSEVVVDNLLIPAKKTYDYKAQKVSLVEHMLKDRYRLLEEHRTCLADEECFCLSFSDIDDPKHIRSFCDVPSDGLALYFVGDSKDVSSFNSIIQSVTRR